MNNQEPSLREEFAVIEDKLQDPSIFSSKEYPKLAKRRQELSEVIVLFDKKNVLEKELNETNSLLDNPDAEMVELAKEEIPRINEEIEKNLEELRTILIPKDENDSRDVIIEIRAAAGGDESSLFAAELYRMYVRWSEKQIINDFSTKLSKNKEHFIDDLRSLRTGRAHSSMLDGIMVEAYGSTMPLIQVATITVPESQLIQITPFDGSNIQAIVSAIRDNQSLGLNPTDDGRVVRVPIPALNAERRQQIVKQLNEKFEDAMIGMRNSRHETLKEADKLKSDKKIGEDDHKRITKKIDELMNDQKVEIEKLAKTKEHDIVTV